MSYCHNTPNFNLSGKSQLAESFIVSIRRNIGIKAVKTPLVTLK